MKKLTYIVLGIALVIVVLGVIWWPRSADSRYQAILADAEQLYNDYKDKWTAAEASCDYSVLVDDQTLADEKQRLDDRAQEWWRAELAEAGTADNVVFGGVWLDMNVVEVVSEETNDRLTSLKNDAYDFIAGSYSDIQATCPADDLVPVEEPTEEPSDPVDQPDDNQTGGDDSGDSQTDGIDTDGSESDPVSLPDDWDNLTAGQKIAINPLDCDLETEVMWTNGTCHPKPESADEPSGLEEPVSGINNDLGDTPYADVAVCKNSGPQYDFNIVTDAVILPGFTSQGATEIAGERATLTLIHDASGHRVMVNQIREDPEVLGEVMDYLGSLETTTRVVVTVNVTTALADNERLVFLVPIGGYCFSGSIDSPGATATEAQYIATMTSLFAAVAANISD